MVKWSKSLRNHDYQALGMSIGLLTTLVPWKGWKGQTVWQGEKLGGETGETVVTSGGQCRQPHGLRDQIWSSRGQQLEEKKQTSKHKK